MVVTILVIGGLGLLVGALGGYLMGRAAGAQANLAAASTERARGESALAAERERASAEIAAERARAAVDLETLRSQSAGLLERERERAEQASLTAAAMRTEVETLKSSLDERAALLEETRNSLSEQFRSMAAQALAGNNQMFLDLAKATMETQQEKATSDLDARRNSIEQLVAPVKETLERMEEDVRSVEKSRQHAYVELQSQVAALSDTQRSLETEARNLGAALRASGSRGQWGELQLRRVVEIAGMVNYCDFTEQAATDTPGDLRRPDLLVKIPGGAQVVVDSKAPMDAYLQAYEVTDEATRSELMKRHAKAVRSHVTSLSSKGYWEQFERSPDFVVLFLPGESLLAAALDADPALMEWAAGINVVLATPSTLIALLRTVAYGWRQERIAENAEEVRRLGVELYERLRGLGAHFEDLRKGLQKAVDSYNKTVGSFESRVLVTARRFDELGATEGQDLPVLVEVESHVRELRANPDARPELPAGVTPLTG